MGWRWLWLVVLVPAAAGVVWLSALGHHLTEMRTALSSAESERAALATERDQLKAERDALRTETAALRAAGRSLSGVAPAALTAGAPVTGSGVVDTAVAPDRYVVRVLPVTPLIELHFSAPAPHRLGEIIAVNGTWTGRAGTRGQPLVEVIVPAPANITGAPPPPARPAGRP